VAQDSLKAHKRGVCPKCNMLKMEITQRWEEGKTYRGFKEGTWETSFFLIAICEKKCLNPYPLASTME